MRTVTAAHDYKDMHHLVDRFSPTQVRRLRLVISQDEEVSRVAEELSESESGEEGGLPEAFLALMGSISAPPD